MNPLELYMLKRFCDQFGIDYQEIDESLTYSEAKKHLMSLVTDFCGIDTLAELGHWHPAVTEAIKKAELAKWESEQERYVQEYYRRNFLHIYVYEQERATDQPEKGSTADIFPWRFSLKSWIRKR